MGWIKLDVDEEEATSDKRSKEDSQRRAPTIHQLEEIYIPEKEVEYLREVYSTTVVQDFDDLFHMTDEERRSTMKGHEDLYRYRQKRVKCTTLLEFVELWREALPIIDEFANSNMVMSPEKFKKMVFRGEIIIGGLMLPEYVGRKKKKDFNWEFIGEYIVDLDKDPKELDGMLTKSTDYTGEEDINEAEIPEKVLRIVDNTEEYNKAESIRVDQTLTAKEKRVLKKSIPALVKGIKELDQAIAKNKRMIARTQNRVAEDDFRWLRRYNKQRGASGKVPEFHGDMMNSKDVERYLVELDNYEYDAGVTEYNGRVYTNDDVKLLNAKQVFENCNWNIRKIYRDKESEKKEKERKKKEKKKEEQIKKLLVTIQQRKKDREQRIKGMPMGRDIDELKNSSKKDKKKNKKKKKKLIKKKKSKYKRILENATVDKRYKNMKAYAKEMEDMSWKK